jgi:hypothetical protein
MIREQQYIKQTDELIRFYKDKKNQSVINYILTCHYYIKELRNIDTIEVFTELEYEKAFKMVLSLVEETFRADYFNSSFSELSDTLVHWLDDEFIVYILGVKEQLKKPIKWKLLIDLQYKYSMARIRWLCINGFTEDFESFAIQNIPISELFKIKP